jgi:hypothetical protein
VVPDTLFPALSEQPTAMVYTRVMSAPTFTPTGPVICQVPPLGSLLTPVIWHFGGVHRSADVTFTLTGTVAFFFVDTGTVLGLALSLWITGGVVSTTWTLKVQVLVLPLSSVLEQVSRVDPIGKVEPEAGVHKGVTVEQLSCAVAEKITGAPAGAVHSAETGLVGQLRLGSVVSETVTVPVQESQAPSASVTVRVTDVLPGL